MSVWSVTYRDAPDVEHVAEVTFDDACAFEDHYNVSAANLSGANFQVRYIAWCIHRALTRQKDITKNFNDWRASIEELAPLVADDTNPTEPTA